MISTWEYYGFHGSLDAAACQTAWLLVKRDVSGKNLIGLVDIPIGEETMHWPVRRGRAWVDLVVAPGPGMTWRMLGEGVVGGCAVCANAAKQYQFGVFVASKKGSMGSGQMTARAPSVSTG